MAHMIILQNVCTGILSELAEIYCAAGTAAQKCLNIRYIETLCSLYSSNFGLLDYRTMRSNAHCFAWFAPARYDSPKPDRLPGLFFLWRENPIELFAGR